MKPFPFSIGEQRLIWFAEGETPKVTPTPQNSQEQAQAIADQHYGDKPELVKDKDGKESVKRVDLSDESKKYEDVFNAHIKEIENKLEKSFGGNQNSDDRKRYDTAIQAFRNTVQTLRKTSIANQEDFEKHLRKAEEIFKDMEQLLPKTKEAYGDKQLSVQSWEEKSRDKWDSAYRKNGEISGYEYAGNIIMDIPDNWLLSDKDTGNFVTDLTTQDVSQSRTRHIFAPNASGRYTVAIRHLDAKPKNTVGENQIGLIPDEIIEAQLIKTGQGIAKLKFVETAPVTSVEEKTKKEEPKAPAATENPPKQDTMPNDITAFADKLKDGPAAPQTATQVPATDSDLKISAESPPQLPVAPDAAFEPFDVDGAPKDPGTEINKGQDDAPKTEPVIEQNPADPPIPEPVEDRSQTSEKSSEPAAEVATAELSSSEEQGGLRNIDAAPPTEPTESAKDPDKKTLDFRRSQKAAALFGIFPKDMREEYANAIRNASGEKMDSVLDEYFSKYTPENEAEKDKIASLRKRAGDFFKSDTLQKFANIIEKGDEMKADDAFSEDEIHKALNDDELKLLDKILSADKKGKAGGQAKDSPGGMTPAAGETTPGGPGGNPENAEKPKTSESAPQDPVQKALDDYKKDNPDKAAAIDGLSSNAKKVLLLVPVGPNGVDKEGLNTWRKSEEGQKLPITDAELNLICDLAPSIKAAIDKAKEPQTPKQKIEKLMKEAGEIIKKDPIAGLMKFFEAAQIFFDNIGSLDKVPTPPAETRPDTAASSPEKTRDPKRTADLAKQLKVEGKPAEQLMNEKIAAKKGLDSKLNPKKEDVKNLRVKNSELEMKNLEYAQQIKEDPSQENKLSYKIKENATAIQNNANDIADLQRSIDTLTSQRRELDKDIVELTNIGIDTRREDEDKERLKKTAV